MTLLIVSCFPICASAHPGKTDVNGGHYDRETGEYHYHHGHPAHDHYDIDGDGIIDCPYNFVDKTGQNSGSSSSGSKRSTSYTTALTIPTTSYTTVPYMTAPNTTVPTESKSEPKTGNKDNFTIIFVMLALCALVVSIQAGLNRDEKKRLEKLNEGKSLENKELKTQNLDKALEIKRLEKLIQDKNLENKRLFDDLAAMRKNQESDKEKISNLQTEVSRLSGADHKCEIYKERYSVLLDMIQRKNQEALLNGYSIDNPISREALEQLNLKIVIPACVIFNDEGLPVLLDRYTSGQYGAYTVYTSINSKIYHADSLCAGYSAYPSHLFHAINCGKRLCRKCANQLKVPDTIPDWYLAVQEIRSKADE